jgi:FdrA protein
MKKILVEKNSYYDSVFLMLISSELKKIPGVTEAVVSMATEVNTELLGGIGFSSPELRGAGANDLVIAVEADEAAVVDQAFRLARELFGRRKSRRESEEAYRPVGLDGALKMAPEANLLIVSVPGRYAAREAGRALEKGLHVMLFSDNVSLEEEIALKRSARAKGLLLMGPDCGTAIINGKPLGFANVVRRGGIGLVAASGTGLQEVTCCIDRLGQGISQAVGIGGRDLSVQVGGTMMLMGIEALKNDPRTEVIVLISKPPAEEVAGKVIARLQEADKPCVAHFIGMEGGRSPTGATGTGVQYAGSLEEAAEMAAALLAGGPYRSGVFAPSEEEMNRLAEREAAGFSGRQRYLRGLFTGGTLADEALILFQREVGGIYSNNQTVPQLLLPDPQRSLRHSIVDLGDDLFTRGRPHPMIDPGTRVERLRQEMEDPEVAVVLLDCVLGYGSHPDPAGAMQEVLLQARDKAADRGGHLAVVASLTGTPGDPQGLEEQKQKLEAAGCLVMPSNYQAARLALRIIRQAGSS